MRGGVLGRAAEPLDGQALVSGPDDLLGLSSRLRHGHSRGDLRLGNERCYAVVDIDSVSRRVDALLTLALPPHQRTLAEPL